MSGNADSEVTVGAELYFVPYDGRYRHQAAPVTVLKVGRKWLNLSNGHRIDRDTFVADSGNFSSPGRCYNSAAVYEAERGADLAWSELVRELRYSRKPKVTEVAVRQAAALLGIELKEPSHV